jgi:hypothetical protein
VGVVISALDFVLFGSLGAAVLIALYFKIFSIAKKLGLNPPFPGNQSEQFKYMRYINTMSKKEEYKELRPWWLLQFYLGIFLTICSVLGIFAYTMQ